MMTLSGGALSIVMGVSAVAQDSLLATSSGYTYWFDLTTWGGILHLVVGVLLVVTGLGGVVADKSWGPRRRRSGDSRQPDHPVHVRAALSGMGHSLDDARSADPVRAHEVLRRDRRSSVNR